MLLLVGLGGCGPGRTQDPLSVLPPPCKLLRAPGPEGCLEAGEAADRSELRFEQAGGVVAVVGDRRSAGELQTEVTLNGRTTWTRTVRRTAAGRWLGSRIVELQPSTGKLLREESYRPEDRGNVVQASSRRLLPDGSTARAAWSFPFPPAVEADSPPGPAPVVQDHGCTPDELRVLQRDVRRALQDGLACMRRQGRSDIAALLLSRYRRAPVELACVQSLEVTPTGFLAAGDAASYMGVVGARRLSFDKASYFRSPDGVRIRTVWHEWLHLWTGPHAPGFELGPQTMEVDRTNACVSLCFGGAKTSRCACELCLGLPPGDARCGGLAACASQDC